MSLSDFGDYLTKIEGSLRSFMHSATYPPKESYLQFITREYLQFANNFCYKFLVDESK